MSLIFCFFITLHWRHNDYDGVSNHHPNGCLLNRLFTPRSKKTSKLRVTGLCVGNSPGPVNSPHKGPVTRKMFPFDDVIMKHSYIMITKATNNTKISVKWRFLANSNDRRKWKRPIKQLLTRPIVRREFICKYDMTSMGIIQNCSNNFNLVTTPFITMQIKSGLTHRITFIH